MADQIETPLAARAFSAFCALGPSRTLRQMGELPAPTSAGKWSAKTVEYWSSRFNWTQRAAEYDKQLGATIAQHIDPALVKDLVEEQVERRAGRLEQARLINQLVDRWIALKGTDEAIKKMSPYAIVQLATLAAQNERLDLGEATNRTENNNTSETLTIIRVVETLPPKQITASSEMTLEGEYEVDPEPRPDNPEQQSPVSPV